MASAFDGLGMGQLGSEKRFMTGSPISELTRMLPTALLGYGLYKSGAIDSLNDMFDPKKALQDKIKGAVAPSSGVGINDGTKGYKPSDMYEAGPGFGPNENAGAMIPPAMNATAQPPMDVNPGVAPSPAPERTIDDDVNDVIPKQTFYSPLNTPVAQNTLTPRDASEDIGMLQIASTPAAPPSPMNLPQYGQNQDGGGNTLATLAKMFLG